MTKILELCLCLTFFFIFTGRTNGQNEPFTDDESVDDTNMADFVKKGWNMLRLGRGIQMLRLGKRSNGKQGLSSKFDHMTPDYEDLKPSEVQAILNYFADEPKDEFSRQPPLPRYGRESNGIRRGSTDDSADLELYRLLLSRLPTRPAGKPAPRGGRYRRSMPDDYYLQLLSNYMFNSKFARDWSQAKNTADVPAPRLERQSGGKTDVIVNNDQSKAPETV